MEAEDFAVMQDPGRRKRLVFRILGVILGLGALVAVFLTATHWFKIHGEAKEAKKASLALKFNTNLDEIDPLRNEPEPNEAAVAWKIAQDFEVTFPELSMLPMYGVRPPYYELRYIDFSTTAHQLTFFYRDLDELEANPNGDLIKAAGFHLLDTIKTNSLSPYTHKNITIRQTDVFAGLAAALAYQGAELWDQGQYALAKKHLVSAALMAHWLESFPHATVAAEGMKIGSFLCAFVGPVSLQETPHLAVSIDLNKAILKALGPLPKMFPICCGTWQFIQSSKAKGSSDSWSHRLLNFCQAIPDETTLNENKFIQAAATFDSNPTFANANKIAKLEWYLDSQIGYGEQSTFGIALVPEGLTQLTALQNRLAVEVEALDQYQKNHSFANLHKIANRYTDPYTGSKIGVGAANGKLAVWFGPNPDEQNVTVGLSEAAPAGVDAPSGASLVAWPTGKQSSTTINIGAPSAAY